MPTAIIETTKPNKVERRRTLAEQHYPLVEKVARRLARRLPAHVEIADLVSAGVLGLMEAAERFDAARGDSFESFAEFRVRGAMLDELRSRDTLSRDMRRRAKALSDATRRVEHQLGRAAASDEVAAGLCISVEALHEQQKDLSGAVVVGLPEMGPDFLDRTADDSVEDAFEATARREQAAQLAAAIDALGEKHRLVVSLYYYEELTLKEIGQVLGVTESRVCQLHREAMNRLHDGLDARREAEAA